MAKDNALNQNTGRYPLAIGDGYKEGTVAFEDYIFRNPKLTVAAVATALKIKDVPADMGMIVKTLGDRQFLVKGPDDVNLNIEPVISVTLCKVLATCHR